MSRGLFVLLAGAGIGVLASGACSTSEGEPEAEVQPILNACEEPRPTSCLGVVSRVCGYRDGFWHSYASDCMACRDPAVSGYRPGPCPNRRF